MIRLRQAVILAGGFGTRLGKATENLPKPLMPIDGKPFLAYLIKLLQWQGISQVVISAGYKAEILQCFALDYSTQDCKIEVVTETEALGTGGALRNCLDRLDAQFLVCNGDTILECNLAELHNVSNGDCAIAVRQVSEASAYGSVEVSDGKVTGFSEKKVAGPGLISGGSYVLTRQIVADSRVGKSSIEQDMLPRLAASGGLAAVPCSGYFIDIGLPSTLKHARETLPRWYRKPIAFLDRDGVLNHDFGHTYQIERFEWVEHARETVKFLNQAGYYVVLVTNQAGIAKGYYGVDDFERLTDWMRDELWVIGAHLDSVYYCPYHIEGVVPGFNSNSYDRKPNPGMLFKAMRDFPALTQGSFFVGDAETDRLAAEAAGIRFCHYESGSLLSRVDGYLAASDAPQDH